MSGSLPRQRPEANGASCRLIPEKIVAPPAWRRTARSWPAPQPPGSPDARTVRATCLALVAGVRRPQVQAIGSGIGVPGQVHVASRKVLSGGYVDLSTLPFADEIETATGLPVRIDNDATMALLAEAACGAARGRANVAMLTIGTGIGGAILSGGGWSCAGAGPQASSAT